MRKHMKKLVVIFTLILGLLGNHSIVYADTTVDEGVSVSIEADKDAYEKDEEITIVTKIKNLKGVSIHDFSLENVIPDGFKVTNGTKKGIDQKELKAGEEIVLSTTFVEGEDYTGLVVGIVLFIIIAVGVGVAFVLNRKKQAMAMMVLLAFCMSSFGPYGLTIMQAKEEKSLSKEAFINYDSKELQFLATVDYEEEVPASNESDTITKGEWVKLLLEKTETDLVNVENGFTYYFSDTKESKYGLAVETAYMRGILPQEESKVFGINEAADREFVAYTVYYIMGFDGKYNLICEDLEEINYVNESALLIQQGFLSLIDDCFMPQNAITDYDKEQILNKIAYFNSSLDIFNMEDICEIEYVDGVVLLETEEYDYTENGEVYTVVLNADVDVSAIKEGTVFIITEKIPYEMSEAFKAVAVYEEDGKITVECTRPQMEEVLEEYKMVGSTFLNPTTIIPEEGVEIEYIPNDTRVASAGRIRIEDSIDSLGTVKFNLAKINVGGKDSGITLQGDFSMEIPEIAFVIEGEGSNLDELTIALSSEEKLTGLKLGWNSAMDEGGRITEEKVKIATFPNIPVAIGASVKVTLYLEFGISGEISLSWSMESLTGMQYKDGAFRTINDTTMSSATSKVEAEMKAGVAPNIALLMFGAWNMAGIDAGLGLAGEVSKTTHTDVTPKLECLDAGVYVYLNLKVDEESTLGKILKATKVSASKDVWKSSNSPWRATYHIENSEVTDVCTYKSGNTVENVVNENLTDIQEQEPQQCEHNFSNATCENASVCTKCGITNGSALGHDYANQKSCSRCGTKNPDYLYMDWRMEGTTLIISGNGPMEDYWNELAYWQPKAPWYGLDIQKVIIEEGITCIGDGAFEYAENLISVFIPKSVTRIGDMAFAYTALTDITIPEGVTSIGERVFECADLTSITIPNSVTSIGDYLFFDCMYLEHVVLSDNLTSIPEGTFYWCEQLETVRMPDSVKTIGENAFLCCCSLSSIIIPESVTYIADSAFDGCVAFGNVLTIYGTPGSYAESYALAKGLPFVAR